jgi:hypothetical protein
MERLLIYGEIAGGTDNRFLAVAALFRMSRVMREATHHRLTSPAIFASRSVTVREQLSATVAS